MVRQQSQRLRRELNSHEKAKPRETRRTRCFAAESLHVHKVSSHQNQDETLLCPTGERLCEQVCGLQSVLRAAAATIVFLRPSVARRLQPQRADIQLRRGAPAVLRQYQDMVCSPAATRAWPNPSLNHRTPNGRLSWPGLRYAVHFLSPGQAILPPGSG